MSPARTRIVAAAAAAGALLLAGCSLDYTQAMEEEQAAEKVPDTVLVNVVHKIHKNGRLNLQLEAARTETFNDENKTILTDAHFTEFNDKGDAATDGRGGTVVFHSDTENAEISDKVRVYSATEKGEVTAESLSWANKERLLTAPPDETVTLKKDDGTSISGSGFQGDFRTRQVVFSGPVHGTYVSSESK